VVGEIAGNSKFAAVQGSVTQAIEAILRCDFHSEAIPSGAANDYLRISHVQRFSFSGGSLQIPRHLPAAARNIMVQAGLDLTKELLLSLAESPA
jgi:hypothetical protein